MGKTGNLANCEVCHLTIRYVDDYVVLNDYIKGQLANTSYFHRVCFRDKINPIKRILNEAEKIMASAKEIK